MPSNTFTFLVGVLLFLAGIAISGGGQRGGVNVGNRAFSVFGSITQSFHSVGLAVTGQRQKTPRDWIGWTLAVIGIVIGLIPLFNP